jgi:hypothetical protein
VNTDPPTESELYRAERRVLGMQTKLHRWAGEDRTRRFDDVFNLVTDPQAARDLRWTRGSACPRSVWFLLLRAERK